jgi:hypothetical protein
MSTSYPGGLDSYATKVDGIDDVMASHINNPQDAIVAIETELGADPAGSFTDVADRLDSIEFRETLPASAFYGTGGPARGLLGEATAAYSAPTWLMDDSANESTGIGFVYTGGASGATITIRVWWAMDSAAAGNIVLGVRALALADGEDATAAGTGTNSTEAVPGTAKYVTYTEFELSISYEAGDLIRLSITRYGANGSDTAAGDLHFVAALVTFS